VSNTTNTAVTWSASCGSFSSATANPATYIAPASAGSCTVTAKSAADPTKNAQATVSVTAPVTISVAPATVASKSNTTQTFTATVGHTTNTAVKWSASCGSLSSTTANPVTYTAPSTSESCTVTATSKADTTKTAIAKVTVTAPVAISVAPATASVETKGTQGFIATVSNTTNTAVTWSATCGTLSSTTTNPVTFTAPATTGGCGVKATSKADTTKTAQATVTVTAPPVSISVAPATASLLTNGTQSFSATVKNTSNTVVVWGASCGTLSSTTANLVTYAAPPTAGNCTVTATIFDGTLVGNSALLFIHDDTQTAGFAATAYTEPSTVTANYVAGLMPGAPYGVAKRTNGGTGQVTITAGGSSHADAAGVLVY